MSTARIISISRDQVGESPVWDVSEQALYWVDIQGRHVHRYDWRARTQQTWNTPERVGCIALSARGGLVAAMESGVFSIELRQAPDVGVSCLARSTHPRPNMRYNDGRCDATGRFWISTLCMDAGDPVAAGAWYCLDERGLSAPLHTGLITPNGLAFSPDGRTMYFSDSHPAVQTIWSFPFDEERGHIGAGRVFVDMKPMPGRPDGAAIDAEGHYWICANDAGLVHRFDPAGAWVASFAVPVPKPSMCAFGGPALDVLLVTSIQPAGAAGGDSGAVFALEVGVCGLPEPRFSRFPASIA